MVQMNNYGAGRPRQDTGKSTASDVFTEDDQVDIDELNERMQSFP